MAAKHSRLYAHGHGERVFATGEPGDSLYVVTLGAVRILQSDAEGSQSVIAELLPGETLGEMDLLTGTARNATAVSEGKTVLLRFPAPGFSFERVLSRHPGVAAHLLFGALRLVAGRLRRANSLIKENSTWVQEARRQVYGDKLTGLYNKSFLEENLQSYLRDSGRPVALLMFKPDNFKLINDTFGHEAGDAVLRLMASELRRSLGPQEVAVRYMGNELAAVLPEHDREAARLRAQALREALGALDISGATGSAEVHLGVSFGVALFPQHARDAAALIAAAHALPLVGRAQGGNRILFPEDAR